MAEKGTLRALHERCAKIQEKVDAEHLRARDSLARILQAVEEKENAIYEQAEAMGIQKLKRQGTGSVFDLLGLGNGDPAFTNLSIIQAAAEKNEKLTPLVDKLYSYIGIKAKYFQVETEMREQYVSKVCKNDSES